MKFLRLSPMLRTTKLKETIAFYTDILGFACESYSEDWGWASLRHDQVVIMVSLPNEHIPFDRPDFTGSLYIEMDDVDRFWEQIKGKASICYPIENFEYGKREFAIYDNNGYLLQFGQNTHSD
ncbi:VOC family protein [Paenibacillus eucommiae]|uniref:Glyoxalase superfamily protein PhnB n=1 Tax=Paenibacillus eucommiae TaxID=1355755 RepID=A0ABS4IVK5_9BACL|nr:VOC family protein [Paenibacillus eucommiae]MBP1991609.1 putative glyoxalase superfamily protein PhnB [Paenibacillus eucommiae]